MTRSPLLLLTFLLALALVATPAAAGPAGDLDDGKAGARAKRLGTDPAGDAVPALDLTFLDVATEGKELEAIIGVENMIPVIGGYPTLPGIEWAFVVRGRTFVAEAYVDNTEGAFLLFEKEGDTFREVAELEGTYDAADGSISMLIPLADIGARKGDKVSGTGESSADAHVHFGVTDYTADTMKVSKSYRIR